MSARSDQVITVGAGPAGLAPAGESALAGVACRVFERRTTRARGSRAICLHARSMETLDLRGQATSCIEAGSRLRAFPLGLEGSSVDLRGLDSDFAYVLN